MATITDIKTVQRVFCTGDPTSAGALGCDLNPGDMVVRTDGGTHYAVTAAGLVLESSLDQSPSFSTVAASTSVTVSGASANALAAATTARACEGIGIPYLHVSTDYVVEGCAVPASPGDEGEPRSVYGLSKLAGEHGVRSHGGFIARVSFVVPERVARHAWLNGYTRASREWVGHAAARLAAFLPRWAPGVPGAPTTWHLAPLAGTSRSPS